MQVEEIKTTVPNVMCTVLSNAHSGSFSPPSYSDYIQLIYGVDCDMELRIDNKTYNVKCCDLFIINSYEIYSFKFNQANNKYILLEFKPENLCSTDRLLLELKYILPLILNDYASSRLISADVINPSPVPDYIKALTYELSTLMYGHKLAASTYVCQILIWLMRYWHALDIPIVSENGLPVVLYNAAKYIHKNIASVTANEVADYCGYSYTYFSEVFKNTINISFREYLLKLRINESAKLLLTTNRGITEIALAVGFSTSSHFIKQFKTTQAITPAQYRTKFKKLSKEGENEL